MKNNILITGIFAFMLSTSGCDTENPILGGGSNNNTNTGGDWLIPLNEVLDGGPGKDGIPALEFPPKVLVGDSDNHYLDDEDLVLGFQSDGEIIAYPHPILDWHEIVNDQVGGQAIAITYCPLTGTGIGWNRVIRGEETTFGVSGLLYNSNLIPYDRATGSNWSQIRLDCVNGSLIGDQAVVLPMIEMPWKTWKKLYPGSQVISTATGYSRNYGTYPYGSYKTSNALIFPARPSDARLQAKERVLAVIIGGHGKVYQFEKFGTELTIIKDTFQATILVVAGIRDEYMVAYNAEIEVGQVLEFSAGVIEGTFIDQEGNVWNLFGQAIAGPRKGQQLKPVPSFMAYWFSIGAFYPEPDIY